MDIMQYSAQFPVGFFNATEEQEGGAACLTGLTLTESPAFSAAPTALGARLWAQLDAYFHGENAAFDIPLHLHGTPFQRAVWEAAAAVPYGCLATYGDLAWAIGNPRAVRAVGNAMGRNPAVILVPCHRIIAQNSMGGFYYGMDIKYALLRLEGIGEPDIRAVQKRSHINRM